MATTAVYDLLVTQLTRHLGVPPEKIHPGATLEELEIDSLALVELLVSIEDETGVKIDVSPQSGSASEVTLAQVADALTEMMAEQHATVPAGS